MATFNSTCVRTSWNTTINTFKEKKGKQGKNYQQCLRKETKVTYIACTAGKAEALFFKAFAQTSYNLKKNRRAFTRFDLLKSKQFRLRKSRKTSALKKK